MAQSSSQTASSAAIFVLGIQLLGLGLVTLLAGTSDEVGTIMVIFVVGLWMVYLIIDGSAFDTVLQKYTTLASAIKE